MTTRGCLPRRQFLIGTGMVMAHTALAGDPARAQLAMQQATTRLHRKVGVAPGYIISERGEH